MTAPHARLTQQMGAENDYMLSHSVYTKEEVTALKTDIHFPPGSIRDKLALGAITLVRKTFDVLSGYDARAGGMTEDKYLTRAIFLETVAGVPGMVASMIRHTESLRLMRCVPVCFGRPSLRRRACAHPAPPHLAQARPRLDPLAAGRGGERAQ